MLPKQPASAEPVEPEPPATIEPIEVAGIEPPASDGPPGDSDRPVRVRRLIAVGVVAVLLAAAATVLAIGNHATRANGALANEAFVDGPATAAVVGQLTSAVKTVYSYDHKALDANEAAAKQVITGKFAEQFDKVFAPVKLLAPREQAVLTSTVAAAGVLWLQGDRARLLMMVDQGGTRGSGQQIAATTARLIVEAERVDGQWKIAEVTPE